MLILIITITDSFGKKAKKRDDIFVLCQPP